MARDKQAHLPSMEPPSVPEIDAAADAFVEARNAWQSRHAPMVEAHDILQAILKKQKLKRYEYGEFLVEVVPSEKVRVKRKRDDAEEGD